MGVDFMDEVQRIYPDFPRPDLGTGWEANLPELPPAVRDILESTVALGGSITAEHGVGLLRRNDMQLQFDESTLNAMRALKSAWDPNGLLNPGKLWEP